MMLDAAEDKEGYTKAAQKLKTRRERYRDYCKANGLSAQNERTQVYGFDRSQSSKATWAARKSSAAALTTAGNGGIIKHKEKEDFIFPDPKITQFLLKPDAKHYKEFVDVGYSENNPQILYDDITGQFDKNKLIENGINSGGNKRYYQLMKLGITKKKDFIAAFQLKNGELYFVTSYRN